MKFNYSDKVKEIIGYSHEEAVRLQNGYIGPEHLMLGILRDGDNDAIQILDKLKLDNTSFKRIIEQEIKKKKEESNFSDDDIAISETARRFLRLRPLESKVLPSEEALPKH